MSIRRLLPLTTFEGAAPGISGRQHVTCVYKCGDQCAAPVPNTSDNPYFGDIAAGISRRGALKAAGVMTLAVGAAHMLPAESTAQGAGGPLGSIGETGSAGGPGIDTAFTPVVPNTADAVTVPEGYRSDVVIRWGDPVLPGAPEFDFENQTATAQAGQYGFNCDLAVMFPMDDRDERFLFTANHEYTTEPSMFRGYEPESPTREQVEIAWAAHGMTVVELASRPGDGGLEPVLGSYNRRITALTPFELRGPAVGSLTRTNADPTGTRVLGTLNNCAGGHTPWGTVLSGEENFNQYFGTAGEVDPARLEELRRYGISASPSGRKWEEFDRRFDLAAEPNEVNRFGYVVEVDPWNPDSTPVKHSAMGRFKHEGATIHVTADGTVVAYSGDDERFDYLYKFVSSRKVVPGGSASARAENMRILDEGTLYVATFSGNSPTAEIDGSGALPSDGAFDGSGTWIPLMTVSANGNAVSHVDGMSAEQVAVHTRMAGDAVGATKMDRPEDVEPSPTTGKVYMALTNNTRRGTGGNPVADEANPRHNNKHGQVVEITDDHGGTAFTWNLLLVCGDPAEADSYFGGFDKAKVSPISCPDNVAFDPGGGLWVSTDGNALGFNDGLYSVATEGTNRGDTKLFLTVPIGAETCGPLVFDNRVIVNVQHPGEKDGASIENPASHWPDGGSSQPRPSTVVAWREGFRGGLGSPAGGSLPAGSLAGGSPGGGSLTR